MVGTLNVAPMSAIRSHFPALARREDNLPVAYFDGPGGTQVPLSVANAVSEYLLSHNANTHWVYRTSRETDSMLLEARRALADFLGGKPEAVAFGANMTTLLFHIARAIGRGLNEGDEVIVTELDHHANIAPWQALARERGIVLKWVPFDAATFRHKEGAFKSLISSRTKVVAVGAASNALGTVTDVAEMVRVAKEAGAVTVVDAVHYAPHHAVDAMAIGADFLLCSAYKFYGPHVGVVHAMPHAVRALSLPRLEPAPSEPPECLETGTQNHEGIAGAMAAVDFLAGLASFAGEAGNANASGAASGLPSHNAGSTQSTRRERLVTVMEELDRRSSALLDKLWNGLSSIKGVTLYGPPPGTPRTATLSFRLNNHSSTNIAKQLSNQGLYVSHGDFYATTVAERLGAPPDGFVRVGCACYTTSDEIDRLVHEVRTISAGVT